MPRVLRAGYQCRTRASSSSTRTARRLWTSTSCRSSRSRTGRSAPSPRSCRTSTSRSAGFQGDEPAARPHPASVREEEAAVAGQGQGREEWRDHEPGRQVGGVTEDSHRLPSPTTPRRPSACGGSAGASAAFRRCARSISTSRRASGAPCSARTARARRRSSTWSAATFPPRAGRSSCSGADVTRSGPDARQHGLARTYQQTRLFLGLTVEDNIYSRSSASSEGACVGDAPAASADARTFTEVAGRVGLADARELSVAFARPAPPAGARDGARRRAAVLMLDEPASGLAPASRAS